MKRTLPNGVSGEGNVFSALRKITDETTRLSALAEGMEIPVAISPENRRLVERAREQILEATGHLGKAAGLLARTCEDLG